MISIYSGGDQDPNLQLKQVEYTSCHDHYQIYETFMLLILTDNQVSAVVKDTIIDKRAIKERLVGVGK